MKKLGQYEASIVTSDSQCAYLVMHIGAHKLDGLPGGRTFTGSNRILVSFISGWG